uniref:Uncharacterized protein n=1 Tax=Leersia perrieri TaxID=77586 RepID=A0A0D9X0S2_9ORYZ
MAIVMNKTSSVVMEDRRSRSRSSAIRRDRPASPREAHVRLNTSSVARKEDANRGGKPRPASSRDERLPPPPPHRTKRRHEDDHGRYYDDAYRACKKKHMADEPAAHVSSSSRTRPSAHASREKEERHARGGRDAAPRREIKDSKDDNGGRRSQERTPVTRRPCVSPPAAPAPVKRPDSFAAQEALTAAIARAREVLHIPEHVQKLREAARREIAAMMKSMADIMRKTSVVSLQEDGLPSSLIRRTPPPRPPPQRDVRVGLRLGASSSATRADDEIAALREEARREVASMVRTVEFNDPYISIADGRKAGGHFARDGEGHLTRRVLSREILHPPLFVEQLGSNHNRASRGSSGIASASTRPHWSLRISN